MRAPETQAKPEGTQSQPAGNTGWKGGILQIKKERRDIRLHDGRVTGPGLTSTTSIYKLGEIHKAMGFGCQTTLVVQDGAREQGTQG